MKDLVFVVTGAHSVSTNPLLLRERSIEYRIGLHKVASYEKPMYGVVSEVTSPSAPEFPPFSEFPFQGLHHIRKDSFPTSYTKSQREFASLQALLPFLSADPEITDNTFVVKVTGRYILMKDNFLNLVERESTNRTSPVDAIFRLAPMSVNGIQMFTFLYAMRFKWFKQVFSKPVTELGGQNIEKFLVNFIAENALCALTVDSLGILTNINNEGQFTVY